MKKLNELFTDASSDVLIKDIKINSKEVEPGDLFVCTKGVTADRHDFIDDAIKRGASALVVSRKDIKRKVPTIHVEDTNKELPYLCAKFYDNPEKQMKMIGVTGTDGKTTVSTVIHTLIGDDICAYLGSNGRSCAKFQKETSNSTPDADKLYKYFHEFLEAGCKYVSFEASSEGFYRNRLVGIKFDVSVLTNITGDHLNIHKTMDNYIDCKCELFKTTKKDGYCILNKEDQYYERVRKSCQGKVLTYGEDETCDLQIISYHLKATGADIKFKYKNQEFTVESPLLGKFNVYNLAAAILSCICLGFDLENLLKKVKDIKIPGRQEVLKTNTPYTIMVDYAHTTNAVKNILEFVKTLDINRSIVVIGSAGQREIEKRPHMGKLVADNATHVIFTADDPRDEDPKQICQDMASDISGYDNYEVEVDRVKAVEKAVNMATDGDLILLLGKGCETEQKLKDGPIHYSDIETGYDAVKKRKKLEI